MRAKFLWAGVMLMIAGANVASPSADDSPGHLTPGRHGRNPQTQKTPSRITETIPLRYSKAEDVVSTVKAYLTANASIMWSHRMNPYAGFLDDLVITADTVGNNLTFDISPRYYDELKVLIAEIDTAAVQFQLDVMIVDVDLTPGGQGLACLSDTLEVAPGHLVWGKIRHAFTTDADNYAKAVHAFHSESQVRMQDAPRVVIRNHGIMWLEKRQDFWYLPFTRPTNTTWLPLSKQVSETLETQIMIKPSINDDGTVKLQALARPMSDSLRNAEYPWDCWPTQAGSKTQIAESTIAPKDGETAVIVGLVPNTANTATVMFITPHVILPKGTGGRRD